MCRLTLFIYDQERALAANFWIISTGSMVSIIIPLAVFLRVPALLRPRHARRRGEIRYPAIDPLPVGPSPPPNVWRANIVIVVLDDTGFGDLGCYGGLGGRVTTPNIDQLAVGRAPLQQFPRQPDVLADSRRAFDRPEPSFGRGWFDHGARQGLSRVQRPGSRRRRRCSRRSCAPEGYSTMALGKWHLTPVEDITPIGPFDLWPLGQGFGRFYGFLRAEVDQYRPELTEDNHALAAPCRPGAGGRYHLSEDLVDHAITWVAEHRAVAPSRPFFCYLAFGAMHQPHQVWPEWSDRYRGAFADGWDVVRRQSLESRKASGWSRRGPSCRPPTLGCRRGRTFQ